MKYRIKQAIIRRPKSKDDGSVVGAMLTPTGMNAKRVAPNKIFISPESAGIYSTINLKLSSLKLMMYTPLSKFSIFN